jgi:DcuC family C4-dicarboxylate transporter
MSVVLTLVAVALLAFTIYKKIYPPMILMIIGIIVLFGITTVNQKSVLPENATSGNMYLDIFEYVRTQFSSIFMSMGTVLMPVLGYSAYINHIGASKLLAVKAIKPFKNLKSPYVFCAIVTILGAFLRLPLPSTTGLLALMTVTVFPVMVAAGMSKGAAGAACLLGASFDWGPAEPNTAMMLAASTEQPLADYFIAYQLPIYPIGILVAAILSIIVNKYYDRKSGYTKEEGLKETVTGEDLKLPGFYALFPVIPLVIMIVFSRVVIGSVVITPFASVIISFIFVFIVEAIRNKNFLKTFDGSKQYFIGMGTCYAEMITLISSATVFAGSVQLIGGFTVMSKFIVGLGVPGIILTILVCAMIILMVMVVASSIPAVTTFSPFAKSIAEAGGFANETVMLPINASFGISRAFSPISSAVVFMAKFLGVEPMEIIKRNAIPFIGAILSMMIAAIFIVG